MNTVTAPPWTLGDRIRKARECRRWKQQELADQLHKSRQAVSSWENGEHAPSYAEIDLIARITEVDVDWLQFGTITGNVTSDYLRPMPYDLPLFEMAS